MSKLFTNWKRSWQTRRTLHDLLRRAEDERAALLRLIDKCERERAELEALNKRMFVNFMARVQHVRREARIALEEARVH